MEWKQDGFQSLENNRTVGAQETWLDYHELARPTDLIKYWKEGIIEDLAMKARTRIDHAFQTVH